MEKDQIIKDLMLRIGSLPPMLPSLDLMKQEASMIAEENKMVLDVTSQ
jgi:hypothetical protein